MLKIKKAGNKDIPLIRDLTYRIWPQTYSSILSPAQIEYMLELIYSEASLEKQMNEEQCRFLFVYDDDEPVGFASTGETEPGIYKLHKIYILPSQQGKGTGKFVIDHIIRELVEKKAKALRLQVNRYNKARSFYEKLGFVVIDEADFDIGNGYFMNDYVMEKKIC
ncbi:MAG TPA: GNAT family N-acetyltransferase [Chitinophagaceae bacterium]|nr:GNAT family N-acetyltransferase [Chitinophagaceae bacterium]